MLSRISVSLVILALVTLSFANDDSSEKTTQTPTKQGRSRSSHVDQWNSYINKQFTDPLAFHYLWPWNQLFKAVVDLDEDAFNEPKVYSSKEKYEVHMNVRRFKPDELSVKVKNKYIIVEGKHKEGENKQYVANHFVQNLVLPAGSKAEEVKAVLKDGVLMVSVPRHELPPPPPERVVPIEVIATEKPTTEAIEPSTEKAEQIDVTSTTEKKVDTDKSSTNLSEQLELVEATTQHGKIRKKELKQPKPSKTNEVSKGIDENGLDYALIDSE